MYIDTCGDMTIVNKRTGDVANIVLKSSKGSGFLGSGKDAHEVQGTINNVHKLYGAYNKTMSVHKQGAHEPVKLWDMPVMRDNWVDVYRFEPFVL